MTKEEITQLSEKVKLGEASIDEAYTLMSFVNGYLENILEELETVVSK